MVSLFPQSNGEPLREFNQCHSPADGKFCSAPDKGSGPGFKEWFEGSTVTNPDGTPRKMYHSTSANPDEFRAYTHFGTAEAANDRADILRDFSVNVVGRKADQSAVFPVYLSIKNPLRMADLAELPSDIESDSGEKWFRSWESETDVSEVLYDMGEISRDEFWDVQYSPVKAFKLLAAKGYDGIVYKNAVEDAGKDSYIVFSPKQIRPALSRPREALREFRGMIRKPRKAGD